MRFVYAQRPKPKLEFGIANQLDAVPLEAEVLAVCDGSMTIRRQSAGVQTQLTAQEESALEALIADSQSSESGEIAGARDDGSIVCRWLKRFREMFAA
jgi:hypothetical protein